MDDLTSVGLKIHSYIYKMKPNTRRKEAKMFSGEFKHT